MNSKVYILFLSLLVSFHLKAQQKTIHTNMIWAGYYNTLRFNKRVSLISDAQLRTRNWPAQWSQQLIRSGINYACNDKLSVTAGFAFFKNAQYAGKQLLFKNEWRPWQEISYQLKFRSAAFSQRLRTEQRFLQQVENGSKTNRYEYVFRLRYRFDLLFPLDERLKLLLGNEVLVNPGYMKNNRFFDQNRTFAGINYKISPVTILQFQFLKIFQWNSSTSVLTDQNVFRVNINQQFTLKKYRDGK